MGKVKDLTEEQREKLVKVREALLAVLEKGTISNKLAKKLPLVLS